MTSTDPTPSGQPGPALNDIWGNAGDAGVGAECSPTRICRNARDFTFDGIAEGGEDLAMSWRRLLEREGKAAPDSTSLRDLVLGPAPSD